MMKDHRIVDKVIADQKKKTSNVFRKFYQLLKSIRREKLNLGDSGRNHQTGSKLPSKGFIDLIICLCRDSFNLLGNGSGYLTVKELGKYCQLLGKDMDTTEFYFFLKKCV